MESGIAFTDQSRVSSFLIMICLPKMISGMVVEDHYKMNKKHISLNPDAVLHQFCDSQESWNCLLLERIDNQNSPLLLYDSQ